MATRAPKALVIPTPKLVEDALALAARFRDVEGLQRHAANRKPLLNGAAAALLVLGLACGAGVFIFLAGRRTRLTLPAVLAAPRVTRGSLDIVHRLRAAGMASFEHLPTRLNPGDEVVSEVGFLHLDVEHREIVVVVSVTHHRRAHFHLHISHF